MSAQIIEEDQERREKERRELRRKQEGERVGLKEEERWRLDLDLVRRRQGGKVGGLIDDRGKVRWNCLDSFALIVVLTIIGMTANATVYDPSIDGITEPFGSSEIAGGGL